MDTDLTINEQIELLILKKEKYVMTFGEVQYYEILNSLLKYNGNYKTLEE